MRVFQTNHLHHSPGDTRNLGCINDVRRHGIDQLSERPDPDPSFHKPPLHVGHIHRMIQLNHTDGAQDTHICNPGQFIEGRQLRP